MSHGDAAGAIDGRMPPAASGPVATRPPTEALLRRLVDIGEKQLVATEKNNSLLEALLAARRAAQASAAKAPTQGGGEVASARDLDSEWGDPEVKTSPRDWKGQDFKGCHMSQCDPEFLEMLAGLLDWKADRPKPGKEKYSAYDRKDAARARGWAERLRAGFQPAERPSPPREEEPFIP